MLLPIEQIRIGDRVRKDMGDLQSLAESITRHGLLHPIVVKKDHTLVAGHRRIEAARLVGLTHIAVTVVDVDDLLSAERDENEIRKDFTPTEAVAIAQLIKERHRQIIEERLPEQRARAARMGVAARIGTSDPIGDAGPSLAVGQSDVVAARAVGMGKATLFRAEKVVAAAKADPKTFGDLPAKMDETGNVSGTYHEMERRKDDKAGRHVVHYRTPLPKPNREMERAVVALDGLCLSLKSVAVDQLDPANVPQWAASIKDAALFLTRLARRLRNVEAA